MELKRIRLAEKTFLGAVEPADLQPGQVKWPGPYKALTQMMYTLRGLCPRLPLLGASAVHPRHPLPTDHLELLAAFARGCNRPILNGAENSTHRFTVPSLLLLGTQWLRCLLCALHDSLIVLCLKLRFGFLARAMKRNPVAIVMKTWCFGAESTKAMDDFYYGKLPQMLRRRNLNCLLLCGNLTRGGHIAFAREILKNNQGYAIPEWLLLPLSAPLVVALKQMLTSLVLRRLARSAVDNKFAMLCAHASLDCLGHSTMINTLYFYVAQTAVKIWNPNAFIALYEGHPWEMLVWQGVRAASKTTVTVGYQHAVVMQHSFSLTWPNHNSWELASPDVVLCLGKATKNMMKVGHKAGKTRLVTFGSFRRGPSNPSHYRPEPERRTVLVVPEGIIQEARVIFNFAAQAACLMPDYRFIFRCHPVLPFDRVYQHLDRELRETPNVEVSNHSIDDDFARSSVVLYRGSSAALYAVLKGLKPIYLHDDSCPDVDPLFEITGWRERVSSVSELKEVLRSYTSTGCYSEIQEWQKAVAYVSGYAGTVDEASIDRFLSAVGLPQYLAVR